MWKCNSCGEEYEAVPGLVRTRILSDGKIESAQPCECGGWRILQAAQQSAQRTACDCGRTDGKHDLFCAVEIEKRDAKPVRRKQ